MGLRRLALYGQLRFAAPSQINTSVANVWDAHRLLDHEYDRYEPKEEGAAQTYVEGGTRRSVEEDVNGGYGDIGLVFFGFFFQVSLEGFYFYFFS